MKNGNSSYYPFIRSSDSYLVKVKYSIILATRFIQVKHFTMVTKSSGKMGHFCDTESGSESNENMCFKF